MNNAMNASKITGWGSRMKPLQSWVALSVASAVLAGCGQSTGVTGVSTSSSSPSSSSVSSSSCTTRVVDSGVKGQTAVVQRGTFSDVKINPVTGYPAIAYTEASISGGNGGSLTITFSYWTGNDWVHEVVGGDGVGAAAGSAQFIRLAFLSTGIPLIFWTTNTTTGARMAGRNVSLSSTAAASWTMGTIDPLSVASSAIEVAVNPLDQVGVHFQHALATATAQGRFVYCLNGCNSPSSYATMATNTDFIDTVGGTSGNQTSVGMAWCRVSSSLYYPAVTYHGSGANLRYAVCLNSPENCGTTGQWSKLSLVAAAGTSIGTKLFIDPLIAGDNPKILARAAAGAGLFPHQISQGCASVPTSFVSGTVLGGGTASTATTGNSWMNVMKDSSGRFHVIANEGVASISYFNQTAATGFATAAWNVAGTVDTGTVPAAFAGAGGAAIDNTNGVIYTSYGMSSAPNNLSLGVVTSPLSNPSNAAIFDVIYPNQTGAIQSNIFSVFQHRNVALAQTSNGRPGVGYIDYSAGGATVAAAAGRLKYAYRDGAPSSSSWIVSVVPGTSNPHFPSIAFDSNDRPWIAYFDETTFGGFKKYYLATNSRADGSGVWSTYQFPLNAKTTVATQPAFDGTAIAMHRSGGRTFPVMITANSHTTGAGLRSARLDPTTGNWNTPVVIDGIASGIYNVSAHFDSSGNIVAAYYDIASNRARYVYTADGGVTWSSPVNVSSTVNHGHGVSVKLNSAGVPAVSYHHRAGNNVFFNQCTLGSAALCANVAGWASPVQVNAGGSVVGLSGTGNPIGTLMTDLNFDSSGAAEVFFPLGAGASSPAGLTRGINTTSAPGVFATSLLNSGPNATVTLNPAASVSNGALSGLSVSSSRSASSGSNATAYVGPGNWLYVTTCGD